MSRFTTLMLSAAKTASRESVYFASPIADQEAQRVDSYAQLGGEIASLPHLRGLDVSGLRQGSVKSMATVTTRDTVLPTIRGH
ncbi:hypothetical protein [Actinacidiphila oryziradicis]|uniref:hypothetical protein n=1 Tax=Actinacidiphila oryziradicis TaxID=2571141 RepID=UPI0026830201|nr:hypothetical protein [Actinacidiphila oryziradicis]